VVDAPDARVNFVVEQIAEHVEVHLITKLTLASGATALGSVMSYEYLRGWLGIRIVTAN
jgi:hypothetical protein